MGLIHTFKDPQLRYIVSKLKEVMVIVKDRDYHSVYHSQETWSLTDSKKFNKNSGMNPWPKSLKRKIKSERLRLRVH